MNILTRIKTKTKVLSRKSNQWKDKAFLAICGIAGAIAAATPARAEGDIDDLFAAVNLSGINTNVKAYFLIGAAILALFIGWRYLKRAGNRV